MRGRSLCPETSAAGATQVCVRRPRASKCAEAVERQVRVNQVVPIVFRGIEAQGKGQGRQQQRSAPNQLGKTMRIRHSAPPKQQGRGSKPGLIRVAVAQPNEPGTAAKPTRKQAQHHQRSRAAGAAAKTAQYGATTGRTGC